MRFNDFFQVLLSLIAVPGGLRVNHHGRSQGTAVQAASRINPDTAFAIEPQRLDFCLHKIPQRLGIMVGTAGPAGLPLVGAEKNMVFVVRVRHGRRVYHL